MKNLDLNYLGVQEMNTQEMQETDGKPSANYILPNLIDGVSFTGKQYHDKIRKKHESGSDVFPDKQMAGKWIKSN